MSAHLLAAASFLGAGGVAGLARLPGLLLLGRRAPRVAGAACLLAGAGLLWLFAGGRAPGLPSAGEVLAAAAGLALAVLLPAARPVRALEEMLGATRSSAAAAALEGHEDAGALWLVPPARAGATPRPPVVVLHGAGCDRLYGVGAVVTRLLEGGHAVLVAHLPGHGAGGSDLFGLARSRERVDLLVAAARERAGPSREVAAVGFSLGGSLLLDALLRGAPLARVAAVGSPLRLRSLGGRAWLEVLGLLRPWLYRALRHATIAQIFPSFGPLRGAALPLRAREGVVETFVLAYEEMRLDERMRAEAPRGEVLWARGALDGIVRPEEAPPLGPARAAGGGVLRVPLAGHLDLPFHGPTVERIAAFVAAPPRGAAASVSARAPSTAQRHLEVPAR